MSVHIEVILDQQQQDYITPIYPQDYEQSI